MRLAEHLATLGVELCRTRNRVLVGIDGPDAAGKSTLADQLVDALEVPAVRASIDGFHQPREQRYQRGELSAEGYYRDSFDYKTLLDKCLIPFRDGAPRLQSAAYDYRVETDHSARVSDIPPRAVLIFDGVFLLREQLREIWTLSVYLRVSPDESLRRALSRDLELFGSEEEIERRYRDRYLPGQAIYRSEADPEAAAHVVVDAERVEAPTVERWPH